MSKKFTIGNDREATIGTTVWDIHSKTVTKRTIVDSWSTGEPRCEAGSATSGELFLTAKEAYEARLKLRQESLAKAKKQAVALEKEIAFIKKELEMI